eukprot:m.211103 g.211103  ORF g.211103 m.211103 type:complete len:511 (-) comp18571_c0_seq3:335-1867(-)
MSTAKGKDADERRPLMTAEDPVSDAVAAASTPAPEQKPVHREMIALLAVAFPIFVARVSWTGMKTVDTTLLGHLGTKYLSAAALSDLWTMASGVFVTGRVLTTFCGQAFGAGNFKLAGIWLQVSLLVLSCLSVFVMILWAITPIVLRGFHEDKELIHYASIYAWILMSCIPVRIAYSQLSQFFQAQRILYPEMLGSAIALGLQIILGLILVLGIPIPGFGGLGFYACPTLTSGLEYLQLFFLAGIFCMCLGLHKKCWPGWSWNHITKDRVVKYLKIYVPAALSSASDFWRFAVIGALAAKLSDTDVAVFNASYRILWICLTFAGSVAGAAGIRLGMSLGAGYAQDAKRIAGIATVLVVIILCGLGLIVFFLSRQLGKIFSSDPEVLDLFYSIRAPLAAMMVLMNLSVFLERIPVAMGRTTAVLLVGLVGSWIGQVPGVVLATKYWRNDLVGLYTGAACGYGLVCVLLLAVIQTSDWQRYADEARERAEMKTVANIQTSNVNDDDDAASDA